LRQHLRTSRPERHADADLVRALTHCICVTNRGSFCPRAFVTPPIERPAVTNSSFLPARFADCRIWFRGRTSGLVTE
jgi:hypothetical protein